MKILVTGANGFLGHYLVAALLEKKVQVIATGKGPCRLPFREHPGFRYAEMDFTQPGEVEQVMQETTPGIVIHCGAVSKPDECEKDQWAAYQVNVEATVTLLESAGSLGCFFIFLSTDFIFPGDTGMYRETDQPGPVNFYGKTKLEAEKAVMEYQHPWAIVRTVLVYGPAVTGRGNLLTVVKEKLEKGEEYKVFDDQVRTPTYVSDLANGIVAIVEKKATGIFHISGEEVLTPYQMACATARFLGYDENLLVKVTAQEFVQPAKRPAITGFDISKAKTQLGFQPLPFAEGLALTFSTVVKRKN
jgi:dTDP-4-dehydrorhamnose reductase